MMKITQTPTLSFNPTAVEIFSIELIFEYFWSMGTDGDSILVFQFLLTFF